MKRVQLFFLAMILMAGTTIQAQSIDQSKSQVAFKISNMGGMNTVEGTIQGMEGSVAFDPGTFSNGTMSVCIDPATIDTDNKKRDEHLMKDDFFGVETYPTICFESTSIAQSETGFVAKGNLTMHGVTQEVEIPFTYADNTFTGTLAVNRKDFGVGGNGTFMVGGQVEMEITCVMN
ncbi:YceI family protein [Pontibacter sp. G13]|uniref:YceI family protein n=1 Tax=Pontibacter sp. G13 TaxID=3074898 RepID=UPI00288A88B5|nr:YceI family protein [Pontibacter sp. G13]WNJ17922.1 YceI family protein [Pontibacter sp. G13]